MTGSITTRENVVVCTNCKTHKSITSYTPLHHLKLPTWVFGYLVTEQIIQHPLPISGEQIRRRLGVAKNTSCLLKKRLMLFWSDVLPLIRELFTEELQEAWSGVQLPKTGNLEAIVAGKPVVSVDTLALFSASQRANGYLGRKKHGGQTASIYLSDRIAVQREEQGRPIQIGTLTHTQAVKGGPVFFNSVPDQKQRTLEPLFHDLPKGTVVFGDEGYPYLWRNRMLQFRGCNHSARAKDGKRNKWARHRYKTVDGVHNNVAEAHQRTFKHAMIAAHSYFRPESSTMRMNEYSALRGVRVYGMQAIAAGKICHISGAVCGNVGNRVF